MTALDRKFSLSHLVEAELFRLPDIFPEQGVAGRRICRNGLFRCGNTPDDAVDSYRILPCNNFLQVVRLKHPGMNHILEGVNADGIVDGRPLGMRVRISRNEGPERCERDDGPGNCENYCNGGNNDHEQTCT